MVDFGPGSNYVSGACYFISLTGVTNIVLDGLMSLYVIG